MRIKKISYLFALIIFLLSCTAKEDPVLIGIITGVVRNTSTNELISNVSVAIANIASTETNSNGQYTFEDLSPNTYEVHFIKEGFQDNISNISVTAGQTTQADVQLTPILPELEITETELDFGATSTSLTFTLSNSGSGELDWNISEQISWLTINPNSGTISTESTSITVTVDRTDLSSGNYQEILTIGSNGGSANIDILMEVTGPVLTVNTQSINFGTDDVTDNFILSNTGIGDLIWQASDDQNWITVIPSDGTIPGGNQVIITVEIDRSFMEPGNNYYGEISLIATNATGSAEITVVATEPSVSQPFLTAYPVNFNFLNDQTEKILYIQNNGSGLLDWQINYNEDWLQFSQTTGNTASGATDEILILVDRTGLVPNDYSDIVSITSNGGTENLNIEMEVLEVQPELSLSTNTLDFGASTSNLTFNISNTGEGNLEWDLAPSQAWIGINISSGTNDHTIIVIVDREGLTPDTYNGSISVSSNGGSDQISISMEVVEDPPILSLNTNSLDFGSTTTTLTFEVSNTGEGSLNWNVSTSQNWIEINPVSGTDNQTINITVDRTELAPNSYNGSVSITSNGGNGQVSISMEVAEDPPILSLNTNSLDFGSATTTLTFDISNTGEGSLNWNISTTQSWVEVNTSSGTNNETINVTVDRTGLSPDNYNSSIDITSNGGNDNVIIVMEVEALTVTDIDGNVYQTVQIGEQVWMAENLKVTHYRNGDAIPHVTENGTWTTTSSGAYCVYNNNSTHADTYGNLYNWYAVDDSRDIAPEGWHLPTDEEIKVLEMSLGMSQSQADATAEWRGTNEGSKLAGRADLWTDSNLENAADFGTSGFNFLPSGIRRYTNGNFDYITINSYFWSASTSDSNYPWYRHISYDDTRIYRSDTDKNYGFIVRCVKN